MTNNEMLKATSGRDTDDAEGLSDSSDVVMPEGHLPDFEGKPVLASCGHCAYCMDQSDGPEYGPSFYGCEKPGKEHMSNLKGFPFKTPRKCCELSFVYLVDWEAEARKAQQECAGA